MPNSRKAPARAPTEQTIVAKKAEFQTAIAIINAHAIKTAAWILSKLAQD